MEESQQSPRTRKTGQPFFVEAAISESGPKLLKIVPSYHQYLVYLDDEMCACIQCNEEGEWEQIEGNFTNGVVGIIGLEITRNQPL